MEHAAKQRMSADGLMQKDQTIKMTEYWEQQLKAMPYFTRKCHMIYLQLIFVLS